MVVSYAVEERVYFTKGVHQMESSFCFHMLSTYSRGSWITRLHFGSGETNMTQWSELLGDGLAVAARYGSGKRSLVPVPCLTGPVVFLNDWESCHRV